MYIKKIFKDICNVFLYTIKMFIKKDYEENKVIYIIEIIFVNLTFHKFSPLFDF